MELNSFSHGYGQITYHTLLVPKYRYNIFYNKRINRDCESILSDICSKNGYKIHAMEVVDNHVHLENKVNSLNCKGSRDLSKEYLMTSNYLNNRAARSLI